MCHSIRLFMSMSRRRLMAVYPTVVRSKEEPRRFVKDAQEFLGFYSFLLDPFCPSDVLILILF